jgi:signal transduction histidine kinase
MESNDTANTHQPTDYVLRDIPPDILESVMLLLGHDLRSPMTIVISAMELLISLYEDDDTMHGTVDIMHGALHASNREIRLVSDLFDLRRLELHSYELNARDTDLVALLRTVLQNEAYAITTKKLKVEMIPPETAPLYAHIDPELVERMLQAILDNVLKFTTRDDTLRVSILSEAEGVVILFQDTGRMVQARFGESILKQPPQWEERQAGTRTSVGLGMPFTYQAAREQGGTFTIQSDMRSGWTTFKLTLPAARPAPGQD